MAIIKDEDLAARPVMAAAPAVAQPMARKPALGTRIGSNIRGTAVGTASALGTGVSQGARAVGNQLNRATMPYRAAGGVARDAVRAGAGMAPAANEGRPLGMSTTMPRLSTTRPQPRVALGENGAMPPTGMLRPVAPRPTIVGENGAMPPASMLRPLAAKPSAAGFQLKPGDVNTITGADGVTRPVPGLLNAGQDPGAAQAALPAPVIAARPQAAPAVRGRQGAIIENPGDSTVDKLMRNMGSLSLRGSPGQRAAVAQAILGEAGARQDERMQTVRTQDQADLAASDQAARAQEAYAGRDLSAQQFNAGMQDARQERLARRPEVTVAADGSMGIVGSDASFRPVTGADGSAVRAPMAPRQTGELTDAERLKSYDARYNAIIGGVGDEKVKKDQLDALNSDPMYASLRGTTAPTLEQFLDEAKQRGSKMSEADLRSYFNANFGH